MLTIEELQQRLGRCHRAMGSQGRLSFTLGQGDTEPCYVAHWVRSGPSSFEDCKAVGVGTVEECLEALERYAARFRPQPTDEQVGRMLGLDAGRFGAKCFEEEEEGGEHAHHYLMAAE